MVPMSSGELAWRADAACRGPHHAIFFPPSVLEKRTDKRNRELRAKEICSGCAVLQECRAYALTIREQHGIWGGLTENERREIELASRPASAAF